jgi:hypothetical protein
MKTNTLKKGKLFQKAGLLTKSEKVWVWDTEHRRIYHGTEEKPVVRTALPMSITTSTLFILIPAANCVELGKCLVELNNDWWNNFCDPKRKENFLYHEKEPLEWMRSDNETDERAKAIARYLKQKGKLWT